MGKNNDDNIRICILVIAILAIVWITITSGYSIRDAVVMNRACDGYDFYDEIGYEGHFNCCNREVIKTDEGYEREKVCVSGGKLR